MSILLVREPGLFTTVQDLGRFGAQALGMPVAGAIDPLALRLANALVGNAPNDGALEIGFMGPALEVQADTARIAIVGSVQASVQQSADAPEKPLEANRSHISGGRCRPTLVRGSAATKAASLPPAMSCR